MLAHHLFQRDLCVQRLIRRRIIQLVRLFPHRASALVLIVDVSRLCLRFLQFLNLPRRDHSLPGSPFLNRSILELALDLPLIFLP